MLMYPTHFIWLWIYLFSSLFISALRIGLQGEDVYLVGDFTGNWKEPIKAIHMGGPRYEVEVRLSQGK